MAAVPEVVQRATRLCVSMALVMVTGLCVLFLTPAIEDPLLTMQVKFATAGAGITCVVSQTPLIGSLAKSGFENAVGTMTGGSLGYVMFFVGYYAAKMWDFMGESVKTEFVVRAAMAPLVAVLGVFLGYAVKMDLSGRLVMLTYLLVAIDNNDYNIAEMAAVGRTSAILVGLFYSNLAQVCVFPKSASSESIRLVREALHVLAELGEAVWDHALRENVTVDVNGKAANGAANGGAVEDGLASHPIVNDEDSTELLERHNYFGRVNDNLNTALAYMQAAEFEAYLGRCCGAGCYVPAHPFNCSKTRLPKGEMERVMLSMRRAARLLYSLHLSLRSSQLLHSLKSHPQASTLIKTISHSTTSVLQQLASSFPAAPSPKQHHQHPHTPPDYSPVPSPLSLSLASLREAGSFLRQVPPPAADSANPTPQAWTPEGSIGEEEGNSSQPAGEGEASRRGLYSPRPGVTLLPSMRGTGASMEAVRWYSWQFILENIIGELELLHDHLDDLLCVL